MGRRVNPNAENVSARPESKMTGYTVCANCGAELCDRCQELKEQLKVAQKERSELLSRAESLEKENAAALKEIESLRKLVLDGNLARIQCEKAMEENASLERLVARYEKALKHIADCDHFQDECDCYYGDNGYTCYRDFTKDALAARVSGSEQALEGKEPKS